MGYRPIAYQSVPERLYASHATLKSRSTLYRRLSEASIVELFCLMVLFTVLFFMYPLRVAWMRHKAKVDSLFFGAMGRSGTIWD